MASYEVGEDGEDSAATAQSRNLLYVYGRSRPSLGRGTDSFLS